MTSAQEQYWDIVRHYLQSKHHVQEGQLSPAARQILEQQRRYLKLLTDEAEAIERSVLQSDSDSKAEDPSPAPDSASAIREPSAPSDDCLPETSSQTEAIPDPEAIFRYRSAYAETIRLQFPPNEVLKLGLQSLQQSLRLSDDAVETIEIGCLDELEAEQQEYPTKLEQYREQFEASRRSIHQESVQDELWRLQRQLGLRSEDVLKLERDVFTQSYLEMDRDPFSTILPSSVLTGIQALEQQLLEAARQEADAAPDPQVVRRNMHPAASEAFLPDAIDRHVADAERGNPAFENHRIPDQPGNPTTSDFSDFAEASFSQERSAFVPPTSIEPAPPSELELAFQELEIHLSPGKLRDWREADLMTYEILLKLAPDDFPGWLDTASIEQMTQVEGLQRIDRLWREASDGRFGLLAQREVYKRVVKQLQAQYQDKMKDDRLQQLYLQEFAREIGWWDRRLKFLKFYKWLSFEADLTIAPDIPQGQFPAYWFWAIPRSYALQLGGIGFGLGGWRVDVSRLRAWVNKLRSCKFE